MSGKETMKTLRKKMINISDISNNSFKKKILFHNKLLNSNNLYKIDNDEDFICEYSNELLNENIKLSGIISPFINPIPCFTVKNDNSKKEISKNGTFFKNMKTQENLNNKENNNENNKSGVPYNLKEKSKILNKDLNKSLINNRYFRAYSPYLDKKQNKLFKSDNLDLFSNNINSTNIINYEKFINVKNKLINNSDKIKINNTKPILSCKKKYIKNHLYYSTDNCLNSPFLKEDKIIRENEEKKNKKITLIKLIGQKINTATMKIEILQSYKKNKNLNSIRKKIEYNKVYCNNDLQRLKDNYSNNINHHLNQIKYLKMRLLKSEEQFLTINKHKEILNKEELEFKIKKMDLIEKIISLQKRINDFLNPDSTNDTYRMDDSFEEKTINDMSLNDYSILKDTIGIEANYSYNYNNKKHNYNGQPLYESKIIKIKPNEINIFNAKFIKNMKEKNAKK